MSINNNLNGANHYTIQPETDTEMIFDNDNITAAKVNINKLLLDEHEKNILISVGN